MIDQNKKKIDLTKVEYEGWLASPITKKVMVLWQRQLDDVNAEMCSGALLRENEHSSMVNYYSVIGYNKALTEIQNYDYETLMGVSEEIKDMINQQEQENDAGNTKAE